MMKKTDSVDQNLKIPNWFNLNSYKSNLTINQWAFEIYIRLNTFESHKFIISNFLKNRDENYNLLAILERIYSSFNATNARQVVQQFQPRLIEKYTRKNNRLKKENSVRATLEGAISLYDSNIKDESTIENMAFNRCISIYLGRWKSRRNYAFFIRKKPIHLFLSEEERTNLYSCFLEEYKDLKIPPLLSRGQAPNSSFRYQFCTPLISINLSYTDTEIKEAFDLFLANSRLAKANHRQKSLVAQGMNRTASKTASWEEYKILALWDLSQWAENFTSSRFKYPLLASTLWPYAERPVENEIDYVERVRKVAFPMMKNAISESTFYLLLANQE